MASADPPEGEWIWRWTLEHRRVAGASGGSIEIFWLGLPGWFERGVEPAGAPRRVDGEAVLGADWDAEVMKRLLPGDRSWLWWTETAPLERLRRAAPGVRRARRLPSTWPAQGTGVVGRGLLRTFGAALLPPDPALHALVIEHGPSSYSEIDPNFVLALAREAPSSGLSPAELERQVARATPGAPGFDLLAGVVDRLVMQWNGDIYCGARARDEAGLLGALKAWSEAHGVRVDVSGRGA